MFIRSFGQLSSSSVQVTSTRCQIFHPRLSSIAHTLTSTITKLRLSMVTPRVIRRTLYVMGTASSHHQGGPPLPSHTCSQFIFPHHTPKYPSRQDTTKSLPRSFLPHAFSNVSGLAFVTALSLLVEVTFTVADLLIDVSALDTTYRIPNSSSHRAMTLKEERSGSFPTRSF